MDRNFLLAFLLSTLAIFIYYTLFPPEQPDVESQQNVSSQVEQVQEGSKNEPIKSIADASSTEPVLTKIDSTNRKTVVVSSDLYDIEIDSLDGVLSSYLLKDYKFSTEPHFNIADFVIGLFTGRGDTDEVWDPDRLVNMAGDISSENKIWRVYSSEGESNLNYQVSADRITVNSNPEFLELKTILPNGLEQHKRLTFYPDSYEIDMEVRIINRTGENKNINPKVNFGAGGEPNSTDTLPQPKVAVTYIEEDFEKFDGGDVEETVKFKNALWVGMMDKYFIHAIKTTDGSNFNGEMTPLNARFDGRDVVIPKVIYVDDPLQLANNQEYSRKFKIYAGPKVEESLKGFDFQLREAMDLGWLPFLSRPLLSLLRWLQSYVINWGVAIILMTIIVRTAMFPLAYKSMTSMRKMQALSPKINALREKYKGNKERMNQEIMKFYGQHKVNPMGGCLPMALQIPIFIALYQALLPAIELRHTPFMLWWADLAAADYTLVLPILMGVSMFVQTSLSPTPMMDPTQAKIMKWMPVMMILFFLNMPSGLVLYWVISNIISVGQQFVFNKLVPRPEPVAVEKGKSKAQTKSKPAKKGK